MKSGYVGVTLQLNLWPIIEPGSSNRPIVKPEAGGADDV